MPSLPFGEATFSKFVRIGTDTRLHGPDVQRLLPTHYTTVYHISLLTDEELKQAIAENVIHPEMMRDHLQKWRNAYRERFVVAPSPKEAASNSAVVGLRIDQTKDAVQSDALPSTTRDDNRTMQDEPPRLPRTLLRRAVATAAETKGPLTRPPGDDDIPAFLDRRPLSAEDEQLFDMIMAARTAPVRQPAVCARGFNACCRRTRRRRMRSYSHQTFSRADYSLSSGVLSGAPISSSSPPFVSLSADILSPHNKCSCSLNLYVPAATLLRSSRIGFVKTRGQFSTAATRTTP